MHCQLPSAVTAGWVPLRKNHSYQAALNELEKAVTKCNTTIIVTDHSQEQRQLPLLSSFSSTIPGVASTQLMLRNPLNHSFGKSSIEVFHLLFFLFLLLNG